MEDRGGKTQGLLNQRDTRIGFLDQSIETRHPYGVLWEISTRWRRLRPKQSRI
jgi:hypothetical protein